MVLLGLSLSFTKCTSTEHVMNEHPKKYHLIPNASEKERRKNLPASSKNKTNRMLSLLLVMTLTFNARNVCMGCFDSLLVCIELSVEFPSSVCAKKKASLTSLRSSNDNHMEVRNASLLYKHGGDGFDMIAVCSTGTNQP